MKQVLKILSVFIIGFIFIIDAKAEGTIKLNMSCPSSANQNTSITCNIYATVTSNEVTTLTLESGVNNGPIEIKNLDYRKSVSVGENIKIGQVLATSKSTSGTANLYVKVKQAMFSDGSQYNNTATNASIDILRSKINTLKNIKIDGATIPDFNSSITNYALKTTKKQIVLTAEKTSQKSEMEGVGTKPLTCGVNTFTINVIAENGAVKNYTINITRTCASTETRVSLDLKDISLSSGNLSPAFKPTITKYEVKLGKEVEKITIKGEKKEEGQVITGNALNQTLEYGENEINIIVSNSNGEKRIYTVNVIREDGRDENSNLSSISLSSGVIKFDKDTLEYEVKVLNNVEKIEVLATPEKETSKVEIKKDDTLKVGENLITIIVTSEKDTKKEYKIKVIRLKENETLGDNPYIENIIIKNYDLKFQKDKENYKLVIKDEKSLDIQVLMQDSSSTYEIIGNENLKDGSIIKIKTISPDGSEKEYSIEITKSDYTIYYIIFAITVLTALTIPVIVYLKSVKKKKEILDVNGYKVGKEYEEKNYSRKVISTNNINQSTNKVNPNTTYNGTVNNNINASVNQPVNKEVTNQVNSIPNLIENGSQNDFDGELNSYTPNKSGTKCPYCKRELLGSPSICPYCKNVIKK